MPVLSAAPLVIIAQAVASTAPQAVYVPPPVPPPSLRPGLPHYAEMRAQRETLLRRQCYSTEAIGLILEAEAKAATPDPARIAKQNALRIELSAAATAVPFDLKRLEIAYKAWRDYQQAASANDDRRRFALLHRLPVADRAIYARTFSYFAAMAPRSLPACGAEPQAPRDPVAPPPPVRLPPLPKR